MEVDAEAKQEKAEWVATLAKHKIDPEQAETIANEVATKRAKHSHPSAPATEGKGSQQQGAHQHGRHQCDLDKRAVEVARPHRSEPYFRPRAKAAGVPEEGVCT